MVREITAQFGIGHHSIQEMMGYWKLCSCWISYLPMDENKKTHMDVSSH